MKGALYISVSLFSILFLFTLSITNVIGAVAPANSKDPTACQAEAYMTAMKFSPKYVKGANPCGAACTTGTAYCQCSWALRECNGNRPFCPVAKECLPCPPGYKCSNGIARK